MYAVESTILTNLSINIANPSPSTQIEETNLLVQDLQVLRMLHHRFLPDHLDRYTSAILRSCPHDLA